jgi:L-lactate dehydrogenase (cytochrome)
MVDAAQPGQVQFLQLYVQAHVLISFLAWPTSRYVNQDRNITKRIVQHAEERGVKGLFITVDAPQLGRREKVSFGLVLSSDFLIRL